MSRRIAVITDSNSGITQKEAEELNVFVLPMPFMIEEETYFEDITLTQEAFYQKLEEGVNVVTSQPSPDSVMKLWDEVLKEYDEIVYIPMSSGLSGSCQSAMMLSQEYGGRVQVINNQRISVTQRQSVLDAKMLAERDLNAAQIKQILEDDKFNSSIYIMLDTLYYLKKGGRITPAAAAIGTMLKLKPVLQIQGEKLDAFAKARTSAQGKQTMINALRNDMENRFGGANTDNIWLYIAYTKDRDAAEKFKQEVGQAFPGFDIYMVPLPLSISCHLGPGALGIGCCKKLK
ncbi:MAG: DegV family protein [Lachnospiraceae bacterium]|nr:DegV family protein [Lachnospiraceae bacterium]